MSVALRSWWLGALAAYFTFMTEIFSTSTGETEAAGDALGRQIVRGTTIALSGEMGAGKTQFVRGLARGLESPARVHSPTFAIVNLYEGGRLSLAHLDLYRLDTSEALLSAGVMEFLQPDGVAVIEWAEKLFLPDPAGKAPLLSEEHPPDNIRRVRIEIVDETTRRILYDDSCV